MYKIESFITLTVKLLLALLNSSLIEKIFNVLYYCKFYMDNYFVLAQEYFTNLIFN